METCPPTDVPSSMKSQHTGLLSIRGAGGGAGGVSRKGGWLLHGSMSVESLMHVCQKIAYILLKLANHPTSYIYVSSSKDKVSTLHTTSPAMGGWSEAITGEHLVGHNVVICL